MSRYRCHLLGLAEELLPTDPHGIIRLFLARAVTLRKGFDDATCGELVRATMGAYLRPGRSVRNPVAETFGRSFSTAFFIKAFLDGDKDRAAEMGVHLSPIDTVKVAVAAPLVIGRVKAVQFLNRVPPARPIVDTYVTWLLRQRLRSYGHPEFRTDASTYRGTARSAGTEPVPADA
jgi:hypothetical protein